VAMGFVRAAYGIDICPLAVATGEEFTMRLKKALGLADDRVTLQLKPVGEVGREKDVVPFACSV
jgi:hypothetical protein